jgi:hypothetical protein
VVISDSFGSTFAELRLPGEENLTGIDRFARK